MNPEIVLIGILLAGMIYCFMTERVAMDLTAFIGLIVLTVAGLITPQEAFSGFSSPPIITIISVFFISAGLRETGIADRVAERAARWTGSSQAMNVLAVGLIAAFFSAFMNNVAAVALLLPSVMAMSARAGLPPSKLLISLSFGTLLGGMTTLIGTPPNMIASDLLRQKTGQGFTLLEFAPLGLVAVVSGVLFLMLWGRHLLPENDPPRSEASAADLVKLYKLFERVFSVRISRGAFLHGKTIADSHLGDTLGAQVIAIIREGKQQLAPGPRDPLREGDVLVLGGRVSDLQALRYFSKVIADNADSITGTSSADVHGATFEVSGGIERGANLAKLAVHSKYGAIVTGILRGEKFIYHDLSRVSLEPGDLLHVLGSYDAIENFKDCPGIGIALSSLAASEILSRHLFVMRIPEDSALGELAVRESRLGELLGLTVVGIVRANHTRLAPPAEEKIKPGDRLLIVGEPHQLERLNIFGEFEILSEPEQRELESSDVGVIEVTLSPRSKLVGNSLREIRFRERYDFQVLGVWREGNPFRARLGDFVLRLGDALLLQGPRNKIPLLATNPDFVVLSGVQHGGRRPDKSWSVICALILLVALPALGIEPAYFAAFVAATLVVALGAVRMQDAYRNVEWRVVFFIACLMPMGTAMEHSGASRLLAEGVAALVSPWGAYGALAVLGTLSSVVSQLLDGAPAAVLLVPVAMSTAQALGVRPEPLVMMVALAASIAFVTPFSHKASLLIMGPGGYRASDFFNIGILMSVLVFVPLVLLIPFFFPF